MRRKYGTLSLQAIDDLLTNLSHTLSILPVLSRVSQSTFLKYFIDWCIITFNVSHFLITSWVNKSSIACKDNVPVYKSKPRHYDTPWMDKETIVTVQNKRKKWKKYIYCKSPQNKELYDEAKEDYLCYW
jgi:hypothetical protein